MNGKDWSTLLIDRFVWEINMRVCFFISIVVIYIHSMNFIGSLSNLGKMEGADALTRQLYDLVNFI